MGKAELHNLWSRCVLVLFALVLGVLTPPAAWAQPGPTGGSRLGGDGAASTDVGSSAAGPVEIQARVVWFGTSNAARPGSWTALRIETTDLGSEAREIIIQAEFDDPDGDAQRATRVVTSNPGQTLGTWLYLRLPFSFQGSDRLRIVISQARATSDGRYVRDRVLTSFEAGSPVGRTVSMTSARVAIIGATDLGLRALSPSNANQTEIPFAHEPLDIDLIGHAALPDRWQGLSVFDALVWGPSTGEEFSPLSLDTSRAEAIAAWVRRGGHLVVVLPSAGQQWSPSSRNPLLGLLPVVDTTRYEGVDLDDYRWYLTDSRTVTLPSEAVVHGFTVAPETPRSLAMPLLAGPDPVGAVAVRRVYGAGVVTLVGLPLGDRRLISLGLPFPEQFWHAVLGGAGDANPAPDRTPPQWSGGTNVVPLDDDIPELISNTGSSAVGVLLGMLLFGVYWALAGPIAFFALGKQRRQHAWVVFVGLTCVFTVIAWAGAQIIRPKQTSAVYVSMLSGVHGGEWVRSRTFASVLVPEYGDAVIAVDDGGGDGGTESSGETSGSGDRESNLISVWDAPGMGGLVSGTGFPDARPYDVNSTRPREMSVPVRQTVKQLEIEWAGPMRGSWRLPEPVALAGDRFEPELVSTGAGRVDGHLVHGLPAALEDVQIVVIEGSVAGPVTTDLLRARGRAYALADAWEPGDLLSLTSLTAPDDMGQARGSLLQGPTGFLGKMANDARPRSVGGWGMTGTNVNDGRSDDRLRALPFLSVLPETAMSQQLQTRVVYNRRMTHGMDLGKWMMQPCVIVTGRIDMDGEDGDAELPVPLSVDGRRVTGRGTVLVWWVYPMAPQPPALAGRAGEESVGG